MSRRKKIGLGIGLGTLALALVVVGLAPSWRNYYLPRGTVRVIEDQGYLPGSSLDAHKLDLYLPTTAARPFSVVVFVHGGFWKPFHRRLLQPLSGLHGCVGVALANQGIATAVVDYRQYPEVRSVQPALDDIARAVRHVTDTIGEKGGDPSQIFIVGHSAGAFMTALLALAPEHLERAGVPKGRVRGFVSMSGVYEQLRYLSGADATGAARAREVAANDGAPERFNPERLVKPGHPPMMLLVSDQDAPQLVDEYRHMKGALQAAGGDVRFAEIPGEDHMDVVMHLSRPNDRVLSEIVRFIKSHGASSSGGS